MQEQKEAKATPQSKLDLDPATMEAALNQAFVRHAIDNRGVLTSPRRGRQVAAQLLEVLQQYLAFEANEADITAVATQFAEQGMAMVTGTQMMRAIFRTLLPLRDTSTTRRLSDFQIIFLEKLANAREIVQQRYQETSQTALQRALHAQLERQISLHDAQKERNANLNQILQLNARLSQAKDEASLLNAAVSGICQALDITHVTLYEALDPIEGSWQVITTTANFLTQGENAPEETADLLNTALEKEGEAIRVYTTESGDGVVVGIILRVGPNLLGALVATKDTLDKETYEEYLILVRTFAQNLAALWHNLYLLNQTQQRAHEMEILHGRYLDSIWNTPEATLQAQADANNLTIVRNMEAAKPTADEETDTIPLQLGDNQFGQVRIPGIETLPEEERAFVQDLIREMGSALNNAQFVQTTRAYSNQLRLASEVSRAATTILDRDQLITEVVELIRSSFNLYYVGLFLVEVGTNTAVLRAGTGEEGKLQISLNHSQEIGGPSMIGTAIAAGKSIVEQNIRHATAFKPNPLLPETQAELALPLKAGPKIIGALTVQSKQPGAFATETITVLQSLADQLAIAIENANLFAQTEQNLAETNRLYTASRRIGQATNAYEIYKTLVDFAQAATTADVVQIIIADPKAPDYLITPVYWSSDDIPVDPAHRFPREKYRYSDRITQTDIVILSDAQQDQEIDPFSLRLFTQHGRHAAAMIPVYIDEEWLATLVLAHKTPNAFANVSLQPLRTLADQAATILANQRLLRQTELLYRIGRALNQAITRDDALGITVRELQAYTGAFQCRFVLYERGEGSGKLVASSNSKAFDRPYHLPLLGDTIFERLSQEQKPIKLSLSSKSTKVSKEAYQMHVTQFGADAALLIPAASQQELLGYLAIDALGGERPFTPANLQFAQTIMDHLTTQLENIKLLDEALHRAQELITLNQVQSNISRVLDLSLLAQTIYAEVGRLLDNTIFHLALYEQEQNLYRPIFTIAEGKPSETDTRTIKPGDPIFEFLNKISPPQVLDNHAPLVQALPLVGKKRLPQSTVWVQLLEDKKPIGLISVQSYLPHAYGESDIQLLRSIATQTSLAIGNARLFQQTQQQNEELRALDKLKTQFLANMSHELRTPLNSIIGFSRVILKGIDGPVTAAQEEDLQSIYTNGQHLLMLINEILDMAKIEAGKMALNFEKIPLHQAINPARDTMRSLITDPVKFVWDVPEDLPEIEADPIRLRQIVLNLLSNAAKFTDEGEIRLQATAQNGHLQLVVEDSGIGIASDDYDKLFTPFAQADGSNTRTVSGTGLGLPITKWLVEMHQGSIDFSSEPNKGTTFYVTLPIVQIKEPATEIPLAPSTIDLVS